MPATRLRTSSRLQYRYMPRLLLYLFVLSYIAYFSWYTINRHETLNSYAADLSLIDQPLWNTGPGPGYFMELTWGTRQQTRLAEHFEPILVPLAAMFWLWDDVRLLLVAQTLVLALGALPVFWIARHLFSEQLPAAELVEWSALACALVYLLYPQLQAANIADFHADPFVVAPLLLAFWFTLQRRWGWMWFWAGVAMLTKENLPTLTAMLGLWIVIAAFRQRSQENHSWRLTLGHGLALTGVSAVWFFIATFLIVAPRAGIYFGTEGPVYLANRFGGNENLLTLLQEPTRWRYLLGLLAAVGFLPLLAPELLLLGFPVLAANLLSNFSGQYSGEQHYSAPLVVLFILAALYGVCRLVAHQPQTEINRQSLKYSALSAAMLWLLAWSLGYHTLHGWTPISVRTEHYQTTAAAAKLPDLLRLVPPGLPVSASAGIHPHLAHRRVIYVFPIVQEASHLLIDVTDIPGTHPNDARAALMDLLAEGWSIQQADTGLILAHKDPADAVALPPCSSQLPLPCSFYTFTAASAPPATSTSLHFGDDQLQLLGYEVQDDPDDGVVIRWHWRANGPLPADVRLWPLLFDDLGNLLNNPAQIPMVATVWYPPEHWPLEQVIVTETLPQLLPDKFHLGLAVGIGENSLTDPSLRLPVHIAGDTKGFQPGHWVQLASFVRQGPFLTQLSPIHGYSELNPIDALFGDSIQLSGYHVPHLKFRPGEALSVLLAWQARSRLSTDYTVFVHLTDDQGRLVAQSDAYPGWLGPQPTSQWPADQVIMDSHNLTLPVDLLPGNYTLQAGLYDRQTMARLSRGDGTNTIDLARITVE